MRPFDIFTPDTLRKNIENLSEGKETILYTKNGDPVLMVVIPQKKLIDTDVYSDDGVFNKEDYNILPPVIQNNADLIHPAFRIIDETGNINEKKFLLISKYPVNINIKNDNNMSFYSFNYSPAGSEEPLTPNEIRKIVRENSTNSVKFHVFNIYEYGLLLSISQKYNLGLKGFTHYNIMDEDKKFVNLYDVSFLIPGDNTPSFDTISNDGKIKNGDIIYYLGTEYQTSETISRTTAEDECFYKGIIRAVKKGSGQNIFIFITDIKPNPKRMNINNIPEDNINYQPFGIKDSVITRFAIIKKTNNDICNVYNIPPIIQFARYSNGTEDTLNWSHDNTLEGIIGLFDSNQYIEGIRLLKETDNKGVLYIYKNTPILDNVYTLNNNIETSDNIITDNNFISTAIKLVVDHDTNRDPQRILKYCNISKNLNNNEFNLFHNDTSSNYYYSKDTFFAMKGLRTNDQPGQTRYIEFTTEVTTETRIKLFTSHILPINLNRGHNIFYRERELFEDNESPEDQHTRFLMVGGHVSRSFSGSGGEKFFGAYEKRYIKSKGNRHLFRFRVATHSDY